MYIQFVLKLFPLVGIGLSEFVYDTMQAHLSWCQIQNSCKWLLCLILLKCFAAKTRVPGRTWGNGLMGINLLYGEVILMLGSHCTREYTHPCIHQNYHCVGYFMKCMLYTLVVISLQVRVTFRSVLRADSVPSLYQSSGDTHSTTPRIAYDMCNLAWLNGAQLPLPFPPPLEQQMWLNATKIIDTFHLKNHISEKCKRLFFKLKSSILAWIRKSENKLSPGCITLSILFLCAMPKLHHLFYLHRMVVRRNQYTVKYYMYGKSQYCLRNSSIVCGVPFIGMVWYYVSVLPVWLIGQS